MNISEVERLRVDGMRTGASSYWLSDVAWTWLKESGRAQGHKTVRGFVEASYREWTSRDLYIQDDALRAFLSERRELGRGGPRDRVLRRAWNDGYGRWPHSLDLSRGCVSALGAWAIAWEIPHNMWSGGGVGSVKGLAGLTLECVGRGWVK